MKTIFICHNYLDESFASMSFHLANHLAAKGDRVVFISKKPYYELENRHTIGQGELILTSWPSKIKSTSFRDFKWFASLYYQYKPSVVIGHHNGSITSIITSKILSFGKTKTLEYYHVCSDSFIEDSKGISLRLRIFFFRKRLFYHLFCDYVICPSEYAKTDLAGFFKNKNGITILNPLPDRLLNQIPKNSTKKIIIAYLGRLDPTKNVLEMLQAFSIHLKEYPESSLELRIAGSGILEESIKTKVKEMEEVKFLGKLNYSQVDGFISESHYLIVPSKFDNLPTVVLEALMNATPVLVSKSTGTAHYLTDDFDGFLFNKDIESMKKLFDRVYLDSSNIKIEEMAKNARETYQRLFTLEKYYEEMEKVI